MAWKPTCGPLFCVALLCLAGCREQEQIRNYTAPRETAPEQPLTRMLAVMVPHGRDVWFFKYEGPQESVTKHAADFDTLIHSVRFTDKADEPIAWTTPEGWRRLPGGALRFATLRLGPKGEGLEITISRLGPEASDVRQNVDRWRGQLGLPPLKDDEFQKVKDNIKVDGVAATRVDLVGVREEGAPPMAAPPRERPQPPEERPQLKYTTPEGWEPRPPIVKQGIRIPVVFRVTSGGSEAEATAMALGGDGGGVKFNVDRWRGQVGLPPTKSEAELRQGLRRLKVGNDEAVYVDIAGTGPGNPKRILGAILPAGGQTWFFTLKGPADLVGKQQSNFEAFVTSVRFGGQPGAAHE
jgi:hypothetical protein